MIPQHQTNTDPLLLKCSAEKRSRLTLTEATDKRTDLWLTLKPLGLPHPLVDVIGGKGSVGNFPKNRNLSTFTLLLHICHYTENPSVRVQIKTRAVPRWGVSLYTPSADSSKKRFPQQENCPSFALFILQTPNTTSLCEEKLVTTDEKRSRKL